jgi:hypothetical protein
LVEIKECVRQKLTIEFIAGASQINLENPDIQAYINEKGHFLLPPLNNKSEIFRVLWQSTPKTDSEKWDYIILLTYLNGGEINYKKIDETYFIVTISF